MFVRSFVCLSLAFVLRNFLVGNATARVRRNRIYEKTGGKGKDIGRQIGPGSNRSSDLNAGGHQRQDSSLGGPKSNLEGQIPAPKVPASKNPAQTFPNSERVERQYAPKACAASNGRRRARDSENRPKGASLSKRRPLLTYLWAWEAKPTKGYIAKEAPFWSFLKFERV